MGRVSILFFLCIVGAPLSLQAELIITEVMYNLEGADGGREWVEVYNNGASTVSLEGWKINDGANHILNQPPENGGQGSLSILSGEVFILASDASQFLSEHTTNVTVIDTVLSLGQQEGTYTILLINKESGVEDEVSYSITLGADGDGNSLHREGGSLTARTPSPGVYSSSEGGGVETIEEGEETVVSSTEESGTSNAPEKRITAHIRERGNIAVVGAPTQFKAEAFGTEGLPLDNARYLWTFGDGSWREGQKIFHTYYYPGEYVVVLDVASGKYSAGDRMTIHALPAEVTISSLGDAQDFYIELNNTSPHDLNISGWVLQSEREYFILPENTILMGNHKIIFSETTTGLSRPALLENVVLLYPNSEVAYRYGEDIPPYNPPEYVTRAPLKRAEEAKEVTIPEEVHEESSPYSSQQASLQEVLPREEGEEEGSLLMWLGALLSLIFVAVFGVFALKSTRNHADEFKIIEEAVEND